MEEKRVYSKWIKKLTMTENGKPGKQIDIPRDLIVRVVNEA